MKKNLTFKETVLVASTFFGMLFGAGNMIFPVHMGQLAGSNFWPAIIGFIITAVSMPLLGIVSLGISKKNNLLELGALVGEKYKYFLTIVLYLTIGPFFAIPRCATTSYTVGLTNIVTDNEKLALFIFTFIFFAVVLFFALKPSGITNYIGKFLNPVFLTFLFILIIVVLFNNNSNISEFKPYDNYATKPFFNGFLEGYNTMDTIASLAFGITIIEIIRKFGVTEEKDITKNILSSGLLACIVMAIIYILTTLIGVKSLSSFQISENGGIALSEISNLYFGKFGNILLLLIITFACLKTALGLVVSCSEMFNAMFPKFLSTKQWAIAFTVFSFVASNFGLTTIIKYSIPVLMFIYPTTICIIVLSIFGKFFNYKKEVYVSAIIFNMLAAFFDLLKTLPAELTNIINVTPAINFAEKYLPLFGLGLGWIIPTAIGIVIGLLINVNHKN